MGDGEIHLQKGVRRNFVCLSIFCTFVFDNLPLKKGGKKGGALIKSKKLYQT